MANHNYKVIYRTKGVASGVAQSIVIPLTGVKSLARYLNSFVKRNPNFEVLTTYIVDDKGEFAKNVKLMREEYVNQKWLTGYKERLLAQAIAQGMDIKWKPCWK